MFKNKYNLPYPVEYFSKQHSDYEVYAGKKYTTYYEKITYPPSKRLVLCNYYKNNQLDTQTLELGT
jgi:hypothetical protein